MVEMAYKWVLFYHDRKYERSSISFGISFRLEVRASACGLLSM